MAWLKQAAFPIYADVDLTPYSEQEFYSTQMEFSHDPITRGELTSLQSPNDSFVVVAFAVPVGSKKTIVKAGQVDSIDKSIDWGSDNEFLPGTASAAFSVAAVDSTHFVLTYLDGVSGYARVGTVNTTTKAITLGPVSSAFDTSGPDPLLVTSLGDGQHVFAVWRDTANVGKGVVGTITYDLDPEVPANHQIGFNTPSQFGSKIGGHGLDVTALNSDRVLVAFQDDNIQGKGTAIVGRLSSFDWDLTCSGPWGSGLQFSSVSTSHLSVATLDSTHAVISYRDSTNDGVARIAKISERDWDQRFGTQSVMGPRIPTIQEITTTSLWPFWTTPTLSSHTQMRMMVRSLRRLSGQSREAKRT